MGRGQAMLQRGVLGTRATSENQQECRAALRMNSLSDEVKLVRYNLTGKKYRVLDSGS